MIRSRPGSGWLLSQGADSRSRTPEVERLTVADLLEANKVRAAEKRFATADAVRYRSETLKAALGQVRAVNFKPSHVEAYVAKRREDRVSDATICRELEVLNAAFGYAVKLGDLRFRPYIERPTLDNVSEREFPQERIPELLDALQRRDEAIADLTEFVSLTARRPEGIRLLARDRFDSKLWTLTIPAEKRGNPVLIGLDGALRRVIERRLALRRLGCDLIFHRDGGRMWEDYDRKLFAEACKKLGLPYGRKSGYTLYSVKSSAVGIMHDAGLSDAEIIDRSGHRTPSMMRRYLKQHPDRAHAASAKVEAYVERKRAEFAESLAVFPRKNGGSVWESNPPVPAEPRRRRI